MPQSTEQFINSGVILSCSADGFPVPDIMWTFQTMTFTNGTVISRNSTYSESTVVISTLLLSHGGVYSCQINSSAVVTSSSSKATVAVLGGKIKQLYVCTYLNMCVNASHTLEHGFNWFEW